MKNRILILLAFIGLTAFFTSCEEDGEKITISTNPIPPALVTIPDLTLERASATDTLIFEGTAVDPGFAASASYFLEACSEGNNFEDVTIIYTGTEVTLIKMSVGEINSILVSSFPADEVSMIDFRLRAVLVVDAGTGALGTGENLLEYSSGAYTQSVTIYGLPRLDLIDSGVEQKVESANGDGVYTGLVNIDVAQAFTLYNPDNETTYGGSGDVLSIDGDALVGTVNGWHKFDVNINNMTYTLAPYSVGVVGAFTDWGELPDGTMEYIPSEGHWTITLDLPTGPMKFRLNSDWGTNWGQGVDADVDLPANGIVDLPNSTGNINITVAGSYTINAVFNGSSGKATFIKN